MTPNIPRITHLINILEALPTTQGFDLTTFADPNPPLSLCGTTACAIGWAALDPTFMAEGFRLCIVNGIHAPPLRAIESFDDLNSLKLPEEQWISVRINGGATTGNEASNQFFGMTHPEFERHFTSDNYTNARGTTAAEVAARLRATFKIA